MICSFTNKGDEILKKLEQEKRIQLNEENIVDYFKAQQTKNFNMPPYYDDLMNQLNNSNVDLNKLDKKYVKPLSSDSVVDKIVGFIIKRLKK